MIRGRLQQTIERIQRKTRRYRTLNYIELNRSAMLHNIDRMRRAGACGNVIPVLKGNAYGHGLREVAEILNDAEIGLIAVDGYFEAGKIRPFTKHSVLVLGYVPPENVALLDTQRCSFVVQDVQGLEAFGRLRRPVKIHMEINTGMNRLGLKPHEISPYLATLDRYKTLRLEGILTHLADADNANTTWTDQQVRCFDSCVQQVLECGWKPKYVHTAQTAGSIKARSRSANAFRLGIGLYGINPLQPGDQRYQLLRELEPVLQLKSTIIKVIDLAKGERVSYNGTFVAPRPMRVATLPLGYYEGVPRALSNSGSFTTAKANIPITGRICMNHTMVDVSETDLGVGDEVTVISARPQQPNNIANLQHQYGLFPYELLANLSSSIRRRIV